MDRLLMKSQVRVPKVDVAANSKTKCTTLFGKEKTEKESYRKAS